MTEFIHDHALILLLLIGTIFTFAWLMRYRNRLNANTMTTIMISIFHTLCGVLSVTVFAFIESGFDINSFGNMSIFGAVFLMPILYFILAKILRTKASEVFDICTICMVFTLMLSRINCIITGCCKGILFFGTTYRWPTREMEIIFYLTFMIFIVKRLKKNGTHGTIYPLYMISYGIFRFITEGVRLYEINSILHIAHIWGIISVLIGVSIYIEIEKVSNKMRRKIK